MHRELSSPETSRRRQSEWRSFCYPQTACLGRLSQSGTADTPTTERPTSTQTPSPSAASSRSSRRKEEIVVKNSQMMATNCCEKWSELNPFMNRTLAVCFRNSIKSHYSGGEKMFRHLIHPFTHSDSNAGMKLCDKFSAHSRFSHYLFCNSSAVRIVNVH